MALLRSTVFDTCGFSIPLDVFGLMSPADLKLGKNYSFMKNVVYVKQNRTVLKTLSQPSSFPYI